MNQFILLAGIGGDLAQTAKNTAEKFGLDAPHFFAQIISFLIVAGLLYKFAYQPILNVLEERRRRIAEGLADAEKIKAELAKTEAARRKILDQTNDLANQLIEEARAAAARVRERETQKAVAAAEQIMARAREAAAQDHERMLAGLKREVGRLVVQTTATVTGKILTPDDQRRLAEETERQLTS
ncbi:MAG: F0F1 ATP synthase subunit B [Verrucomicrobiota bacterium]|jgi:F-type H+-transporting ATPase subunit b